MEIGESVIDEDLTKMFKKQNKQKKCKSNKYVNSNRMDWKFLNNREEQGKQ